jgi:hypothetical protein
MPEKSSPRYLLFVHSNVSLSKVYLKSWSVAREKNNAMLNSLMFNNFTMDNGTMGFDDDINAAILDIARDNGFDEGEAVETLNACATDMSPLERAQMLEALGGVRFETIKDLARQITEINAGQQREIQDKMRPTSE